MYPGVTTPCGAARIQMGSGDNPFICFIHINMSKIALTSMTGFVWDKFEKLLRVTLKSQM